MGKTGSMPSNLERFGNRTQVLQANTAGMYIYANVKIQAFSVFKKKKIITLPLSGISGNKN